MKKIQSEVQKHKLQKQLRLTNNNNDSRVGNNNRDANVVVVVSSIVDELLVN